VLPGLEEQATYDPSAYVYTAGAHAAAVAVDLSTGAVEIEGYWVVNDSGVLVNPAIVDGQIHGSLVQGHRHGPLRAGRVLTGRLARRRVRPAHRCPRLACA
jgi:CO/xanthine dehydrogenase Mo-binding subunit